MKPLPLDLRPAVVAALVSAYPGKPLGRTAVMKLCYFLQELKGVPLGYDFRMFTYGPFDEDVLSDLGDARAAGAVVEAVVTHGRGYGYEITPGARAERWCQKLAATAPDVAEVVKNTVAEFGGFTAGELELRSTVVFVDREFTRDGVAANAQAVAERVHAVKPHFTTDTIKEAIRQMRGHLKTRAPGADDIPI